MEQLEEAVSAAALERVCSSGAPRLRDAQVPANRTASETADLTSGSLSQRVQTRFRSSVTLCTPSLGEARPSALHGSTLLALFGCRRVATLRTKARVDEGRRQRRANPCSRIATVFAQAVAAPPPPDLAALERRVVERMREREAARALVERALDRRPSHRVTASRGPGPRCISLRCLQLVHHTHSSRGASARWNPDSARVGEKLEHLSISPRA